MFRVRRELRETILFARHNVLKDPPFSHLSLATCRNLLIYLNRSAQSRVLQIVHFALDPGTYLLLGSSESVEGTGDLYITIDREQYIFQSRAMQARPIPPVPDIAPATRGAETREPVAGDTGNHAMERLSPMALHYQVLEHYAPPSVLVNADYDIVHLSEQAGRYMQISGGEPSYNLLKVVLPELRMELRGALYSAEQNGVIVRTAPMPVHSGEGDENIIAVVRPVTGSAETARASCW